MADITVKDGATVTRGQMIGTAGATGCVNPPTAIHLHFGVFRTTNLSGHRKWDLTFPNKDRGVSSIQGVIDPFGWNAPKQIDPWAWAFLGPQTDQYEGAITNPGAFSIYLWRSGQAPRTHN
jgi:murein DD-endopeptidase MepM/ murein hydrolase activator NlpD